MKFAVGIVGIAAAVAALLAPVAAQAQALKCVDPSGKITYADAKLPGHTCSPVQGSVNVVSPPPAKAAPQKMPPASSQPSSSAERRKSLESKLAAEQRALDDARKELAEQEAVRYGDERNYQRVLDRLQPYQERVEHHQEMVDSIQRELSNLR